MKIVRRLFPTGRRWRLDVLTCSIRDCVPCRYCSHVCEIRCVIAATFTVNGLVRFGASNSASKRRMFRRAHVTSRHVRNNLPKAVQRRFAYYYYCRDRHDDDVRKGRQKPRRNKWFDSHYHNNVIGTFCESGVTF